jgi:GR25 family glycosyltransferase involved in LPS biosynthesis
MKTYVINLKRRPDRLTRFLENVGNFLPNFDLQIIEAIDGETLNPYEERDNISEWNFRNLSEKKLKAVIACCKSHLMAYKYFLNENFSHALIFEDDAHPNVPPETLQDEIESINLPENFGIIYLNKFTMQKISPKTQELIRIKSGTTAESYIISKEFAEVAYDNISKQMGALDRHLNLLIEGNEATHFTFYETKKQLFYQYNRRDTDIQRR